MTLPAIFSNNMVLQRNANIALWGTSENKDSTITAILYEGEKETNSFKVISKQKTSPKSSTWLNKWYMELPPCSEGGPYKLEISDKDEIKTFSNIMVGEVWLAGGQSNMELELQNCENGKEVVKNMTNLPIRFYYTQKISTVGETLFQAEKQTCWQECNSQNVPCWSAVGFYAAKKLSEELSKKENKTITVGVIGCNWGGTIACNWIDQKTLSARKDTSVYLDEYYDVVNNQRYEDYLVEKQKYDNYRVDWLKRCDEYYATHKNPEWEKVLEDIGDSYWPGPIGPMYEYRPCGLYESMISRIAPYTLKGFWYYQGESDEPKPHLYYELLSSLIKTWRRDWKNNELYFIIIQLPPYESSGFPKSWPVIRQAQLNAFKTIKNTGIVNISDCAEKMNIHPLNKKDPGTRLALQTLYQAYDVKNENAMVPIFSHSVISESTVKAYFNYAEKGLVLKNATEKAQVYPADKDVAGLFEIAAKDKVFVKADVKLENNYIVFSSKDITEPCYIRYAWSNYFEPLLFGSNGLPAFPFTTEE